MNLNLKKPIAVRAGVAKEFAKQGGDTGGRAAPAGYKRLTINMEASLHKELRLAALENGMTATSIIEQLVQKYVVKQKKP
jgi:hypothetical protein